MKTNELIEFEMQDFLKKFNFEEIRHSDNKILVSNKNCNLFFYEEYGDIYLELSDPRDKEIVYNFGIIVKSLLNESLNMFSDINDLKLRNHWQLQNYARILQEKLPYILNGDFSWVIKYKAFEELSKRMFKKLKSLEKNNPIYVKYLANDQSWKMDILSILD